MQIFKKKININDVDIFIFDFDGVLTNNLVHLDQESKEFVSCNRSDGLAFDVLKKINKPAYIISTEKNPVVMARANKLKISAIQGVGDKVKELEVLADKNNISLARFCYIGNDLNDYKAMQICGYTACPSDSHKKIKQIATITLKTEGGNGVVRELLEDIFQLDFVKILY